MAGIKIIFFTIGFSLFLITGCSEKKTADKYVDGLVFDKEELLSPQQKEELNQLYKQHEEKTSNEIVLFTTSGYDSDSSISSYATNTANKMGIGKKEKDNGVIIVFSKNRREIWIGTGYGTENVLTDQIAKKIIDSLMIPEFKEGNTYKGLYAGSKAIVTFLEEPGHEIKEK
ncbi:MAG: hypothetical protein JWM14_726 [Chitinophagaceae bacterium]|nr:hypothetical protein [Chitinophagaceae bacterium]